ncbi:MAG: hypothetical protein J6Z36_01900 [Clostridia bacterium]|nr:hypothetical protein [Clostridia bacterium]
MVELRIDDSIWAAQRIKTMGLPEEEPITEPIIADDAIEVRLSAEAVNPIALRYTVELSNVSDGESLVVAVYAGDDFREYPIEGDVASQEVTDLQPNTEYTIEVRKGDMTLALQVVTTPDVEGIAPIG